MQVGEEGIMANLDTWTAFGYHPIIASYYRIDMTRALIFPGQRVPDSWNGQRPLCHLPDARLGEEVDDALDQKLSVMFRGPEQELTLGLRMPSQH